MRVGGITSAVVGLMCSVFVPFTGAAFGQMWTVLSAALTAWVSRTGELRMDLAEHERRVIVVAHVHGLERDRSLPYSENVRSYLPWSHTHMG